MPTCSSGDWNHILISNMQFGQNPTENRRRRTSRPEIRPCHENPRHPSPPSVSTKPFENHSAQRSCPHKLPTQSRSPPSSRPQFPREPPNSAPTGGHRRWRPNSTPSRADPPPWRPSGPGSSSSSRSVRRPPASPSWVATTPPPASAPARLASSPHPRGPSLHTAVSNGKRLTRPRCRATVS